MRYDKGPLGALMDEYERAANEYVQCIESVRPELYDAILDPNTEDELCRSIRSISAHVISAGYGYANGIRRAFGSAIEAADQFNPDASTYPSKMEIPAAMHLMLEYSVRTLDGHWNMTDDQVNEQMVPMRWKDRYDLETLFEHAICHVLRHRRQVERLLAQAVLTTSVSSATTGP